MGFAALFGSPYDTLRGLRLLQTPAGDLGGESSVRETWHQLVEPFVPAR